MTFSIHTLWPRLQKPALFTRGEKDFWTDAYISTEMLKVHLNPDTDAASRKPETIERTVNWLISRLRLPLLSEVVDLGCGPGLYTERLARRGLRITGVDQSANSIGYARRHAQEEGLEIEYCLQNYLEMDFKNRFDAALLIYYDFGPLSDVDRDTLLARTWLALKPGGYFIFDVLTPTNRPAELPAPNWSLSPEGGFWSPGAYLELNQTFRYPEAQVFLDQTTVIEEDGRAVVYRAWEHCYRPETIRPVLERAGFLIEEITADLNGTPYTEESISMGIIARKA